MTLEELKSKKEEILNEIGKLIIKQRIANARTIDAKRLYDANPTLENQVNYATINATRVNLLSEITLKKDYLAKIEIQIKLLQAGQPTNK